MSDAESLAVCAAQAAACVEMMREHGAGAPRMDDVIATGLSGPKGVWIAIAAHA